MLSRKKEGRKSKKGVFFSFFVPSFLLVCVFSLTKLKRRNDKNVLFLPDVKILLSFPVNETFIQFLGYGITVQMLTNEHQFLLTVAVTLIPVTVYPRIVLTELLQLCRRHGGIPLSGVLQLHLTACLLKDITEVGLVLKPAHTLGTYDALGPLACHKFIEAAEVERLPPVVYEGAYAIFLCLAFLFVVMVVAVTALASLRMVVVVLVLIFIVVMVLVLFLIVVALRYGMLV